MRFGMSMLAVLMLTGSVTFAQTVADIATLERRVEDARTAYSRVQPAADEQELREIEDDLAYLRVKTRRGETVTVRERRDLSQRIDRFMTRASGRTTSNNTGAYERTPRANERTPRADRSVGGRAQIPAGSEVDTRLQTHLDSDSAQVEDRVEATTMVDLYQGDDLLIPAGSTLEGYVSSVDRASRTDRKGELTIMFTRLKANGRTYDIRAYPTQALESEGLKGEAERIGAGAGVGAIIGGILGGLKGAITGILIGGGGVIAATEGKDVELPPGTVLRVRFDTAVPLGH